LQRQYAVAARWLSRCSRACAYLAAAKGLGLTVPDKLFALADEVIE
jgi:hypothetical protein